MSAGQNIDLDNVKNKDKDGKLPLHLALENKATFEVISALLAAYPEAVKEKDKYGRFPLHSAAENKATFEVISALLTAYPEAAKEKDDDGKLPLHHAVVSEAMFEVISALLTAYPEAVKEKDKDGSLPFCYAVVSEATVEVISALLTAYPEAAKEKASYLRMLPLHLALENKATFEFIFALLTAYPGAAKEKDILGRLPLHYAALHGATVEVISALLTAYPEALKEKDKWGRFPLHSAVENKATFEFISTLVLYDLPISDSDGTPVDQHSHSWAYIIDLFSKDEEKSKAVIRYVFDKVKHISGACLALAYAKHETSGNEVIHIAHQEARNLMYEYIFFCGCYELHPGPPVHFSATAVVISALDHGVTKEYEVVYEDQLATNRTASNKLSLEGFQEILNILEPNKSMADKAADLFASFDKNHSLGLSKEEFLHVVATRFGKSRKVVIKFMRNESEWQREIDVRSKYGLNGNFVIAPVSDSFKKKTFNEGLRDLRMYDGAPLSDFKYGFIMPFGDRSLNEIHLKENPDLQHIKTYMLELAKALQHCHGNGIIHGDLKMLNVMRLDGMDGGLR